MSEQQDLFQFDLAPVIHEGIAAVTFCTAEAKGKSILNNGTVVKDLLVARSLGHKKTVAARYAGVDPSAFGRLLDRGQAKWSKYFDENGDVKEGSRLKEEIDATEDPEAVFYQYWHRTGVLLLMQQTDIIRRAAPNNVKAAIELRKQLMEEMRPPAKENGSAVKGVPGLVGEIAGQLDQMGVEAVMELHIRATNKIPLLAKKKQEIMEAEVVDDGCDRAAV